jgi:hypothetical protein
VPFGAAAGEQTPTPLLGFNHSEGFDHRRRPDTFRTAMAIAFLWPTTTTSFLPLVDSCGELVPLQHGVVRGHDGNDRRWIPSPNSCG